VALLFLWIILIAISVINNSQFFSKTTFNAVVFNMCILGVLAIGQAIVVLSGGILDLSLAVPLILAGCLSVIFYDRGWSTLPLIAASIFLSGIFGLINAFFIVIMKINPLIVTLGSGFAGGGLLLILFDRAMVNPKSWIAEFGTSYTLNVPSAWWPMLFFTVVVHIFIKYSRPGRRLVAVGGNPVAAKVSGISLARYRVGTFFVASIIAGTAGIVFAAFTPEIRPSSGTLYTLPMIAAVVLAGFSLSGGAGNFLALFISVGFLSTVPTALVFFGLESLWEPFFQGVILIIAVSLDAARTKKTVNRG
jgi:ribose/xylose/arabinose/galactoside ABC-type transport system permease subunit